MVAARDWGETGAAVAALGLGMIKDWWQAGQGNCLPEKLLSSRIFWPQFGQLNLKVLMEYSAHPLMGRT